MKGATTEPCERTKRPPKSITTMTEGISQNFLFSIKNFNNSINTLI